MFGDSASLTKFAFGGDLVYSERDGPRLLSWASPMTTVPLAPADFFRFTLDDRYLISLADFSITVRELASGLTTTQDVSLSHARMFATNQASGVTLVEVDGAITLYPPTGRPLTLATTWARAEVSPSASAALYTVFGAPHFVRLDPSATPQPIGNGRGVLGISDRHAFIRDLDGICALAF